MNRTLSAIATVINERVRRFLSKICKKSPADDQPATFGRHRVLVPDAELRGVNQLVTSLTAMARGYRISSWVTMGQVGMLNEAIKTEELSSWTPMLRWVRERVGGKFVVVPAGIIRLWNVDQTTLSIGPVEPRERCEDPLAAVLRLVRSLPYRPDFALASGPNPSFDPDLPPTVRMPGHAVIGDPHQRAHAMLHELSHFIYREITPRDRFHRHLHNSKDYAIEECIAELAALYMLSDMGIYDTKMARRAIQYLRHWFGKLDADHNALMKITSGAQRVVDFVRLCERRAFEANGLIGSES